MQSATNHLEPGKTRPVQESLCFGICKIKQMDNCKFDMTDFRFFANESSRRAAGSAAKLVQGIRAQVETTPPFGLTPGLKRLAVAMGPCFTVTRLLLSCLLFSAWFVATEPLPAQSGTPEETGLRIARDARAREEGFRDFTAQQVMVLRNKQGRESRRKLRVQVLEVADDGNKSLFIFDEPRDVQGTAFLVHAHRDGADDQWLYLPALRRVKRISSANQSGSFMGSEFAYEDLSPAEVEKFTYRYLREEPCGDLVCTVTERVPVSRGSNYSRHLVWRGRDELRVHKIEYYDRKNAHFKTLTLSDYAQYGGRYWRAGEMTMVSHLTGKSTVVIWSDYRFGTGLEDSDFTQTSLRRAR